MNKTEAKAKRQELLAEIDAFEKKRCENCKTSSLNKALVHCKCPAAVKIRKLGKQYESIAIKAREGRQRKVIAECKKEGLNMRTYLTLKVMGLIDKAVYKALGIKQEVFIEWKYESGLTKNPRRKVAKQSV